MITIEHLQVDFEVAGEGDERVFARYFSRFIKEWAGAQREEEALQKRLRQDQLLGDAGRGREGQ